MLQFGPDAYPHSADPESMVIIDARGDGKFTFTVKFRGVEGPASRPMLRHMERNAPQRTAPAYLQAGDRPHL